MDGRRLFPCSFGIVSRRTAFGQGMNRWPSKRLAGSLGKCGACVCMCVFFIVFSSLPRIFRFFKKMSRNAAKLTIFRLRAGYELVYWPIFLTHCRAILLVISTRTSIWSSISGHKYGLNWLRSSSPKITRRSSKSHFNITLLISG